VAGGSQTVTRPGTLPERVAGQSVTTRFFDVLGIVPLAGRTFREEDARSGRARGGHQRTLLAQPLRKRFRRSSAAA
jgi:hypothetical protein